MQNPSGNIPHSKSSPTQYVRSPKPKPKSSSFLPTIEALEAREVLSGSPTGIPEGWSVARVWNEELLDAIRIDTPRPTVHARNLFHTSIAMYDAWAAYDGGATGYLSNEAATAADIEAAQNEAVSFAAYRILSERFEHSPGAATSLASFDELMDCLGYDTSFVSTVGSSPAAIGNRVAEAVLTYGLGDGANEVNGYVDTTGYTPSNPPLVVTDTGTTVVDQNLWQPLVVKGNTQSFLTPHWGNVTPFAMTKSDPDAVYHDPGAPPQLGGVGDAEFKDAILRVIEFSSILDPAPGVMIDISPSSNGNNTLGADDGSGHAINPATGLPYSENVVNLADYGRVLAEFWADGPHSETPPGHWNTIANEVSDKMDTLAVPKLIGGTEVVANELEWDVKLYFSLNGGVHDAAVAAWDIKEAYDYVRPITMIRHMGGLGQSSDPSRPSYHPDGLPLQPGGVEVITSATTAAGQRHDHLAGHEGEIAIFAWAGHPDDPSGVGGVDWILAEDWLPYQAEGFVTPPFGAYTSGHSTFSRSAAEVLTLFTGSEYFPGGVGEFVADGNSYLNFEGGPTETITLQWATYYDAADEAGISRLYGGIHVDADDYAGRISGSEIGIGAFAKASSYFDGSGVGATDLAISNDGTTTVRKNGGVIEVLNGVGTVLASEPSSSIRSLEITGGAGPDTMVVDFASGGAFSFVGGITFDGGAGLRDTVRVLGTDSAEVMEVTDTRVHVNNLTTTTEGVERLELMAAGGDDYFRLANTSWGGGIELSGGAGDDTYRLSGVHSRLDLIDSTGTELLDFSEGDYGVRINLGTTRSQYVGGARIRLGGTFENVTGTSHADYIVGNSSDNVLNGRGGRDFLIGHWGDDLLRGGAGNDYIDGGFGDDILVGGDGNDLILDTFGVNVMLGGAGTDLMLGIGRNSLQLSDATIYDNNDEALQAIHAECTSPNSYEDRIQHLRFGGGLNGDVLLTPGETISADDDAAMAASVTAPWWMWHFYSMKIG